MIASRRRLVLAAGLGALLLLLLVTVLLGFALGARPVAPGAVVDALLHPDTSDNDHMVVRDLRVPRTLIGLVVGAALGLAGTVMQGVTRNPVADPGLLGVNAGASLFVVVAITWLGIGSPSGFVPFAFAGAAAASALVYGIGTIGRGGAASVRLALVGAAFTAGATSLISLVLVTDLDTLNVYRFWVVGSLAGRDADLLVTLGPFLAGGLVLAFAIARDLDVLALGDEVARGLGQRLGRARAAAAVAIVLLCGSATALAGPIVFVGLVVPHVARRLTGPDHRWMLPYAMVLGAVLMIAADVIGRLVVRPGELEVGLVAAFLGAPLMIAIVRRSRIAAL
jgi:iron complex transport system permease protein